MSKTDTLAKRLEALEVLPCRITYLRRTPILRLIHVPSMKQHAEVAIAGVTWDAFYRDNKGELLSFASAEAIARVEHLVETLEKKAG